MNQSLSYPSVTKKKIIVKGKRMFCFHCGITLVTEGSFCFGCGAKKMITLIGDNTLTEREVIGHYFHCGFDYEAIIHFLKTHCDISLSERTLKRRLQKYNLRQISKANDSVLWTIINRELETPSQCLRYSGIWHLLRKPHSIQIPWERVL